LPSFRWTAKSRKSDSRDFNDGGKISTDGNYILTSRVQRPFSYLLPANDFPQEVEIWDMSGKSVYKVASVPLQDNIPVDGVTTAPRSLRLDSDRSATLVWRKRSTRQSEAKVEFRDKMMKIAAPFHGCADGNRQNAASFGGRTFGERDGLLPSPITTATRASGDFS
jgi:hypothetical protein